MAKKSFEIQGAKLRIGGLDLEAGATNIAVPGVTQATTYRVEEVEEQDGDSPSTFGRNTNNVKIIDNAQYLVLSGTTPSGSYVPAEYSVDELDDGEIEEIEVDVEGVFASADKTRAEAANMWAIVSSDPYTNFVAGDWTSIPFRPKIRAGEVEAIGGGADLGNLKILGSTLGTQGADSNSWGDHNLYLDPGGESNAYISIPSVPNQEEGNALQIYNKGDATSIVQVFGQGGVQIVTNTGDDELVFEFDTRGAIRLPDGGDIINSSGQSVLGGGSNSYTPDDTDNWEDPAVNTVQAALDELAARVAALQNFEIDGGNAYTPAAGELLIDGNGA